jgi:hypothetical protein
VVANNAADQAQQASLQGGVLSAPDQSEPKYQQLAQAKIVPLALKLLDKLFDTPTKPGEAVPLSSAERLDKSGTSYGQRQQEVAPKVLSPAGLERFNEAGQSARDVQTGADAQISAAKKALQQDAAGNVPTDPMQKTLDPEWHMEEVLTAQDRAKQAIIRGDDGGVDFNFDNLETGDDVKALIDAVAKVDEAATIEAKRGVQTNVQTKEDAARLVADDVGLTKRILNRKVGQLMNAAEMTAARSIMTNSAEKLDAMAAQIAKMKAGGNVDAGLLLRFRRQMAIHAGVQMQVKGAQTEIARALQSFRIPVGSNLGPEMVADILNGHGGIGEAIRLAEGYQTAVRKGGRAGGNKFVAGGWASRANGVFQEVYVNGLLSWVSTQYKNLFSSPIFMIARGAEEFMAGVYGAGYRSALRAAGKPVNPDGVYMGDVVARFTGSARNFRNAMSIAADVWRTELPSDALTKIDANQYKAIDAEKLGVTHWGAGKAIDILGKGIRLPQRALLSVDEFWKALSNGGEAFVQAKHAMHRAKAAGKTDEEAMDDALMIMLDPRAIGKEMNAEARAVTLTTELAEAGEWVAAMGKMAHIIQRNPAGRMILPFITVPTNDVIEVIRRSPAFWLMAKGRADILGKNGPAAMQKAMGRITLGTATMYGTYEMALNGRITGGVPTDAKERKKLYLGRPNWKPYSLVFRGDGWPVDEDGDELPLYDPKTGLANGPLNYVPYGGYGPVAGMMAIGASVAERMRTTTDPDMQTAIVANSIAATFGYFGNMPFLMNVASIYKAIDYDDPGYLLDAPVSNLIPGTPLAIPYSSAGRNIAKIFNTKKQSASVSYVLYTTEDVEGMDKVNGQYQYGLVGMPKGPTSNFEAFRGMMGEYWQLQTKDSLLALAGDFRPTDEMATEYDVLGREIETGVRFDVNPVLAITNLVSPLKVFPGRKPTEVEEILVSLGVPLSRSRASISVHGRSIPLSKKQQSDWVNLAKNDTELDKDDALYKGKKTGVEYQTFEDALFTLFGSLIWNHHSTTVDDHINMVQNLEGKFYAAALSDLLAMPENANLAQAYADLEELGDLGMSRIGKQ